MVTVGYANEVGESFRALVHKFWVQASYGVAIIYVLADTTDKTIKENNKEKAKEKYNSGRVVAAAADTVVWQGLASVIVPGIINVDPTLALLLFAFLLFSFFFRIHNQQNMCFDFIFFK